MNYHVFTTVSLMTSNIRGSLYKKTSHEILKELKAAFKTGSEVPTRPTQSPTTCVNSQLSPTLAVATKRKGEEERSETKFSSCNDRNPKWIINDYYIFFPNLRIWVFLRTPFFKTQHVGPMLHIQSDSYSYLFPYVCM